MRIVLIALALAACGNPGIRVEYQKVMVPTPVPCVDRKDIPVPVDKPVAWTGNAETDVRLATAQGLRWREIALDALALLGPCARD